MNTLLRTLLPQKLKYRLFMAFALLILLPLWVLNVYNYNNIEKIIQDEISKQSHEQLENVHKALQDQISVAFKSVLFLEQDPTVRSILKKPELNNKSENIRQMEEKFKGLNTSFFLYNPSVYFMVLDLKGHVYSSYLPKETLNYHSILAYRGFQEAQKDDATFQWLPLDVNDVFRDISTSSYLLSLYKTMRDETNHEPYGIARISIDYSNWFQSTFYRSYGNQQYYTITGQGEVVAQSAANIDIAHSVLQQITSSRGKGYIIDEESNFLINYVYIESLDWYIVSNIPLHILFDKIHALEQSYYLTFGLCMGAFILIAFMISFAVTRPLSHMQKKMSEVVNEDFKIRLPVKRYTGEIQALAHTFNTMSSDMNELIQRLKVEVRQKEAVQFHMLLAQLNPHFLLNTLNTMKWIALRNKQEGISEICMSLGKLLETSLNSKVDLIYLKEEIELIHAYVYIQQIRYNNQFVVHYDNVDRHEYVLVPKLSLQPLVENAIQHGLTHRSQGGIIHIRIREIEQQTLVLEVEDNGEGVDKSQHLQNHRKRPGIGLENIKQRLRLLFKEEGTMEIIPLSEGTLVRLTFPYMLSAPYTKEGDWHVESHSR